MDVRYVEDYLFEINDWEGIRRKLESEREIIAERIFKQNVMELKYTWLNGFAF